MADLEYAKRGLVGVLTPQANTTVEPEFNILWPDGVGMINARMTSDKGTIVDRLYDYVDQIEATFDRFANAPIDAACFGCTGASYLIGRAREAEICETILRNRGYPFVTAARSVCDSFVALGAKRIGLASPYPPDLTESSIGYWESAGFTWPKSRVPLTPTAISTRSIAFRQAVRRKVSSFWSTRTWMPSSCLVRVCRRSDRSWMLPTGPAPLSRLVCSALPGVRCYTSTMKSPRKPICWPGAKELLGALACQISNPLETELAQRFITLHFLGRL